MAEAKWDAGENSPLRPGETGEEEMWPRRFCLCAVRTAIREGERGEGEIGRVESRKEKRAGLSGLLFFLPTNVLDQVKQFERSVDGDPFVLLFGERVIGQFQFNAGANPIVPDVDLGLEMKRGGIDR